MCVGGDAQEVEGRRRDDRGERAEGGREGGRRGWAGQGRGTRDERPELSVPEDKVAVG